MYLFPKYEDMNVPGKLKKFLQDLYSGKLHREFHYGPDKEEETTGGSETDGGANSSSGDPEMTTGTMTGATTGATRHFWCISRRSGAPLS